MEAFSSLRNFIRLCDPIHFCHVNFCLIEMLTIETFFGCFLNNL
jgi:hypothetical protein